MNWLKKIVKALRRGPALKKLTLRRFTLLEFNTFCLAGKLHHIPPARVQDDFRRYLMHMDVPRYVSDSVTTGGYRKKQG